MLFGEGVSCRILYSVVGCLCVGCSRSITSIGEEILVANWSAIVCLCGFCARVGILFLLVLEMGCVILLWHSLGILYNYLAQYVASKLQMDIHCRQLLIGHFSNSIFLTKS